MDEIVHLTFERRVAGNHTVHTGSIHSTGPGMAIHSHGMEQLVGHGATSAGLTHK